MSAAPVLRSTLVCPACGAARSEVMPEDACRIAWACPACGAVLKPPPGSCCVFCAYGTVPCPPAQAEGEGGGCCRPAGTGPGGAG